MKHAPSFWFFRMTAVLFMAFALFIWLGGGLVLPARSPATVLHFTGASLFLFGLWPFVLGLGFYWVADKPGRRRGRTTGYFCSAAAAIAGVAFLLAGGY